MQLFSPILNSRLLAYCLKHNHQVHNLQKLNDLIKPAIKTMMGVRQGCVFSPLLFNIYVSDFPKSRSQDIAVSLLLINYVSIVNSGQMTSSFSQKVKKAWTSFWETWKPTVTWIISKLTQTKLKVHDLQQDLCSYSRKKKFSPLVQAPVPHKLSLTVISSSSYFPSHQFQCQVIFFVSPLGEHYETRCVNCSESNLNVVFLRGSLFLPV